MLRCLIYWCFTSYFKGVNYYILGRSAYYRIGTQLFEYLIIYGDQWITSTSAYFSSTTICSSVSISMVLVRKGFPWEEDGESGGVPCFSFISSWPRCRWQNGTSKDGRYQDHDWRDSDGYVEDLFFIFFRNQGQDDGVAVAKALVVEPSAAIIGD